MQTSFFYRVGFMTLSQYMYNSLKVWPLKPWSLARTSWNFHAPIEHYLDYTHVYVYIKYIYVILLVKGTQTDRTKQYVPNLYRSRGIINWSMWHKEIADFFTLVSIGIERTERPKNEWICVALLISLILFILCYVRK